MNKTSCMCPRLYLNTSFLCLSVFLQLVFSSRSKRSY
uniref:Uncharacterized protein n=1 Tax=Rhizophora mucronata TaxID=61149 RepID=A0A2P2IIU3_RHIMU